MKMLHIEWMKLKHRHVFIPLFVLIIIDILWLFAISSIAFYSQAETRTFSYLTFSAVASNGLIFPLFIALFTSRICENEHKGRMFALLSTSNVSRKKLFTVKVIFVIFVYTFFLLLNCVFIYVVSQRQHLEVDFNIFLRYFICMTLSGTLVAIIQTFLSLYFEKQVIGISCGIIGSFIALTTSGMLPVAVGIWIPWNYFSLLSPVKLVYKARGSIENNDMWFLFIGITIVWIILSFSFSRIMMGRERS